MLPAVEIDGKLVTESDDILIALEQAFGPLNGHSMTAPNIVRIRRLERQLFGAWCQWLCYNSYSQQEEDHGKESFINAAKAVESALAETPGPYFLKDFGTCDVIITPYIERMNASLFYYKNYDLRKEHPKMGEWFDAMETRECYRGTQSDFSTHAHDLPPQMGGCYFTFGTKTNEASQLIDNGPHMAIPQEVNPDSRPEPELSKEEAAFRVIKFHENMQSVNPFGAAAYDDGMRSTLTYMLTGEKVVPTEKDAGLALRYVRDRISVPRDMPIWSAK